MRSRIRLSTATRVAAKLAGIFWLVSLAWILASDRLLQLLLRDAESLSWLQSVKGSAFVIIVGLLWFWLFRRELARRFGRERALARERARFEGTFQEAPVGICDLSLDGRIGHPNRTLLQLLGYSAGELSGRPRAELVHPADRALDAREFNELVRGARDAYATEKRYLRKDGSAFWGGLRMALIRDARGEPDYVVAIVADVSARREAEDGRRQAARMLESLQEAVAVTASDGRILRVNPAFGVLTGLPGVGGSWRDLLQPGAGGGSGAEAPEKLLEEGRSWKGELWLRRQDGSGFPVLASVGRFADPLLPEARLLWVFSDISRYKEDQAQLAFLSTRDPLTGLSNRTEFRANLEGQLALSKAAGRHLWLLCVDLDSFNDVNSTLGEAAGDQLLRDTAGRLLGLASSPDHVARLSADEFVLLVERAGDDVTEIVELVRQLQTRLSEACQAEQETVFVTASVGVACFPADAGSADDLLRGAQAAVAEAKRGGRQSYRFFSATLNREASARFWMIGELMHAVERDELSLVYQPRVTPSGAAPAVEALLRWHSPQLGEVPPGRFIPVAEESGLIGPIGRWVLRRACEQGARWAQAGRPTRISVNLSLEQFREGGVEDEVRAALRESGLPAELLELEITESVIAHDPESAIRHLQSLRNLGLSLAIDDFGTGYSSMSHLKLFAIDCLKIDKSFVDGLPDDPDDAAIVRAILALAASLGLKTVAEGVETEAQAAFLAALGCDQLQGYFYARPLPPDQAWDYLQARPAGQRRRP